MLNKGVYEIREGDKHRSHCDDRIEQVKKELAESEAILAEAPELRETYVR
jgi:hypothetical protein